MADIDRKRKARLILRRVFEDREGSVTEQMYVTAVVDIEINPTNVGSIKYCQVIGAEWLDDNQTGEKCAVCQPENERIRAECNGLLEAIETALANEYNGGEWKKTMRVMVIAARKKGGV